MTAALDVAVDYQPATTGPFLWQAFDATTVSSDLAAIARAGFRQVRVGLAWDSFMPDARGVDRRRLGEFETLLRAAISHGLRVVPVLFVQAHGDCVFLPGRTVRRDRRRRGVRVLSQGLLEPGGPPDLWTDPLMLELADRWARTMAAGFANHPAVAAWDLGDDPASVVRPRRIADLASWVALMAAPLREQGDRVQLTLGAGDLLRARGVRLAAVAPHLDRIDVTVRPAQLRSLHLADASALCLIARLGQALAGDADIAIGLALATPSPDGDAEGIDEVAAAATVDQLVERRTETGVCGLRAIRWCDLHPRLGERAPFDRDGWLQRCGLVRLDGAEKPVLGPWTRAARAELDVAPPGRWPRHLDVEAFYANLPDSLLDLAAGWHREQGDQPAILDRGGA
ncbi:MAG: hypothetical protein ABSH07_01535 [Candidatus Dormibacteria bacterium]